MTEPHVDLVGFSDGELSDAEADTIREHLRACDVCAASLFEVLELTARLSTLSAAESLERHVPRKRLAFPGHLAPSSAGGESMKPESVQQMEPRASRREVVPAGMAPVIIRQDDHGLFEDSPRGQDWLDTTTRKTQ